MVVSRPVTLQRTGVRFPPAPHRGLPGIPVLHHRNSGGPPPPREWGSHCLAVSPETVVRLTPTCAGSTTARCCAASPGSTHPHVCGEHRRPPTATTSAPTTHPHVRGEHTVHVAGTCVSMDSPPRAWGARVLVGAQHADGRLTPTCVGSTRAVMSRAARRRTHPHVRGEHAYARVKAIEATDSPPRTWGAPRSTR